MPQSENGLHIKMGVKRLTERQILKIFFPDFGFRAPFYWILGPCNSSGMRFHVSFWPRLRILPACNKVQIADLSVRQKCFVLFSTHWIRI